MKSHIISLCNYMDLTTEPIVVELTRKELEGDVELELHNTRMLMKRTEEVAVVAERDTVELTLKSKSKKFNRSGLRLNAGMGLYNKELEKTLIGRRVGETYTVLLKNGEVTVTIESCHRTVIPELTDELVCSQKSLGAKTVEEYKARLAERFTTLYRDSYLEWYAVQLLDRWAEASQWAVDPAEEEKWIAGWSKREEEYSAFHDTYVQENYEGELAEMNRKDAMQSLHALLIDGFLSGRDYRCETLDTVTDKETLDSVRKRVIKPLTAYLSTKFQLKWEEENV